MSSLARPARPDSGRSRWGTALSTIVLFVAALWVIEFVDSLMNNRLDGLGVVPREQDGAVGILFAPALHAGWGHLISNTVPLLVFGFLLLLSGVEHWLELTGVIWVVSGLGVWLTGPENTIHLGASVLVFGWLTCLLVRGFVSRKPGQIAVGLVVLVAYGGLLVGVLPGQPGVSWQGHLFGAVGGVLAAVLLSDRRAPALRS